MASDLLLPFGNVQQSNPLIPVSEIPEPPLKPWSSARVTTREGKLSKAGFTPDRDPVVQASAAAGFLRDILETKTGHRYEVRGVVAIPGWLVDPSLQHGTVCVIDPKNFPDHVAAQPSVLSAQEVKDLAFELSRHIRSVSEVAG